MDNYINMPIRRNGEAIQTTEDVLCARLHAVEARLSVAREVQHLALRVVGAAHDLRNHLTTVIGHLELLKDQIPAEEGADLESALAVAHTARALVMQIFSPPASSAASSVTHLPAVIGEALNRTWLLWRERPKLTISTDLAPTPPLRANPLEVQQVLINLIMNALNTMQEGGTLTLRSDVDGNYVRVTVADTGTGIAPHLLPTLFEPFASARPGGLGIGLALSRALIESAGGSLHVESEVGRGTTFVLRLPAA